MASASRNPLTLTIVVQTSIIMLNFCFTECAGVTCLNFGHSCWGAHGKRSDIQDAAPALRVLAAKAAPLSDFPQNGNAAYPSKAQWLLSRLVAGQPVLPLTDKYHVRWNNIPKDRAYAPASWERDATSANNENPESMRVSIDNANGKQAGNAKGTMCNTNERLENAAEILLVSPDEYEKPINDLHNFDILKLLNMRNGKTE